MGRGVIAKNNGDAVDIKNRGGKVFDEKRSLHHAVKIVPGENIRMGDYLTCEFYAENGRHLIRKSKGDDKPNCYAGEDLANIDGTAFIDLSRGAVYNNV